MRAHDISANRDERPADHISPILASPGAVRSPARSCHTLDDRTRIGYNRTRNGYAKS
jgi:hypothetical protein